jgi:hypothetical protein
MSDIIEQLDREANYLVNRDCRKHIQERFLDFAQIDNAIKRGPTITLTEPGNHQRIVSFADTEIEFHAITIDKSKHKQALIDIANAILQAVQ